MPKMPKNLPQPITAYTDEVFNDLTLASTVLLSEIDSPTMPTAELTKITNHIFKRLFSLERLLISRYRRDSVHTLSELPNAAGIVRFDRIVKIFLDAADKVEGILQRQASGEFELYGAILSEFIEEEK